MSAAAVGHLSFMNQAAAPLVRQVNQKRSKEMSQGKRERNQRLKVTNFRRN
jgi:hypothetical protein